MVVCTRWHCHLWTEPGSAAPLHLCKHPRALFVVAVVISFEKSCKKSYSPGELGDCGVGFVSVLCLVFYHLPVSADAVDAIIYTLFLVSAKYSMVQWQ